jgi:hypothetical protein
MRENHLHVAGCRAIRQNFHREIFAVKHRGEFLVWHN